MLPSRAAMKQNLAGVASLAVDVFTARRRDGLRGTLVLLLSCGASGLLLGGLLLLYLLLALDYAPAAAGGIAGCVATLLAAALFCSRRARCFAALFVISVFLKKSRNLLLAAGTSLVLLGNVRNTLDNLAGLLRGMICNLRAKKSAVAAPFGNYVEMLKWIGHVLRGITSLGVVKFHSELKVSPRLESGPFREKLLDAEQRLNDTVKYAQSLVRAVSSATDRLFPALGFLALALFIAAHIRRYRGDVRYQNRFVTGRFVRFDEGQKAAARPHVLPLTAEERRRYAAVPSARPAAGEGRAALKFGASVVVHFVAWVTFVAVDALLYCFVSLVTTKLSELEPIHVPLLMSIKGISTLIGIPFSEENHQKDFSYSVTLFEKECLPEPKLLLHNSLAPLVAILLVLLAMTLAAGKTAQLRLLVCERFFPEAAEQRAEHLHATVLRRRAKGRREGGGRGISSVIAKPHFWFPLLFRPKEDRPSVA